MFNYLFTATKWSLPAKTKNCNWSIFDSTTTSLKKTDECLRCFWENLLIAASQRWMWKTNSNVYYIDCTWFLYIECSNKDFWRKEIWILFFLNTIDRIVFTCGKGPWLFYNPTHDHWCVFHRNTNYHVWLNTSFLEPNYRNMFAFPIEIRRESAKHVFFFAWEEATCWQLHRSEGGD